MARESDRTAGRAFAVVVLLAIGRAWSQEVAGARPPDDRAGEGRGQQAERCASRHHLGAPGVTAVRDPGRAEHERVEHRRGEHERDPGAGRDAAGDQPARDRDGAALADRKREASESGDRDLESRRQTPDRAEGPLREKDRDRRGRDRAHEDEGQRLDHDRGEDEQERLRGRPVPEARRRRDDHEQDEHAEQPPERRLRDGPRLPGPREAQPPRLDLEGRRRVDSPIHDRKCGGL